MILKHFVETIIGLLLALLMGLATVRSCTFISSKSRTPQPDGPSVVIHGQRNSSAHEAATQAERLHEQVKELEIIIERVPVPPDEDNERGEKKDQPRQ